MEKSTHISDRMIKGKISGSFSEEKYDPEGYKYRQVSIQLDGLTYLAKMVELLTFSEGDTVVMEYDKKGDQLLALSGINFSTGKSWGDAPRKLKKYKERFDHFVLVRGNVTEKRIKNEMQLASDDSAAGTSMILIIHDKQYIVSTPFGRKTTIGDEVGLVLHGEYQRPFVWQNFTTVKKKGAFPVHYIIYAVVLAMAYGCFEGYRAGRMDLLAISITMGLIGGVFLLMAYFSKVEYDLTKEALEYLRLSKPSR